MKDVLLVCSWYMTTSIMKRHAAEISEMDRQTPVKLGIALENRCDMGLVVVQYLSNNLETTEIYGRDGEKFGLEREEGCYMGYLVKRKPQSGIET